MYHDESVHLIIGSHGNQMEDILRDLKSFTSGKLKEAIKNNNHESRREWLIWMMERAGKLNPNNKGYQFWNQDNRPIELFDNEIMQQKLDYIHNNPVEGGFVDSPEDWRWSSARDYAGLKGLLEIRFIE